MKKVQGKLDASWMRVGLVVSRFNDLYTRSNLDGAIECLKMHGAKEENLTVVWVPGSFEVPQALSALADKGEVDALIGLGVVIEGATDHASLITQNVAAQCAALSLAKKIPVVDGVIGAKTPEQAAERSGGKQGNRGWACALVAIEMANLLKGL
ncbi:MAG TPA: 6,7-dimethyl-8-ribityllumazine synthase [Kiritimatiellia bacterium]|nr:6,7-dimethyl-8-ribityllumazine synthase [Kiritimatiellia bacterium]